MSHFLLLIALFFDVSNSASGPVERNCYITGNCENSGLFSPNIFRGLRTESRDVFGSDPSRIIGGFTSSTDFKSLTTATVPQSTATSITTVVTPRLLRPDCYNCPGCYTFLGFFFIFLDCYSVTLFQKIIFFP